MRVKATTASSFYYPDITVVCGEPQFLDANVDTLINPTLIIEVLSPSSEYIDRQVKAKHYRQISSLQEYLFVNQDELLIEYHLRKGSKWEITDYRDIADIIDLISIDCRLALVDVYEKISFENNEQSGFLSEN